VTRRKGTNVTVKSDAQKDIAQHILRYELDMLPKEILRFTTGFCHSVYHVKTDAGDYVLRITSEENRAFYLGSIKWLPALANLDIPAPRVIRHGQYGNVFYVLMSYICGRDLGEVYATLNNSQKRSITKALSEIQKKVSTLPSVGVYGYDGHPFDTWIDFLHSHVERSRGRIERNKVFDAKVCDTVCSAIDAMHGYLSSVAPLPFLDDTTTKNVLVHDGKLAGIVDIDEICYGDPLFVVALTNMALLFMKLDTTYVDFWLDELDATPAQRRAVKLYTLMFCIDFMGEQGMTFDNGNHVAVNHEITELLNAIFSTLMDA